MELSNKDLFMARDFSRLQYHGNDRYETAYGDKFRSISMLVSMEGGNDCLNSKTFGFCMIICKTWTLIFLLKCSFVSKYG